MTSLFFKHATSFLVSACKGFPQRDATSVVVASYRLSMFSDNLIEQTSKLPEGVAHVRGPWLAKRMSKGLTIKKRPLSFRLKKAHGETKNCQSVQ